MKVHVFKIEQFFEEQFVLKAELQYPFVNIEMKVDDQKTVEFVMDETRSSLELDASHEFITEVSCNCKTFKNQQGCEHLIMACWEFRKRGFPGEEASEKSMPNLQVSTVINEMDDRSLRQFLRGYASRNSEFNQVIKLLFSHEANSAIPYEVIKEQLFKLFQQFRTRLDVKKHQHTFEFYLRTFTGVAEDLIAKKEYRPGGFYALASWELWMEKRSHLNRMKDAESNYGQVLMVIDRVERSPISPELYKYIVQSIKTKLQKEDIHPILSYDIPEMLLEWEELTEEEYEDLVLSKIMDSQEPEYWVNRFIDTIETYSPEQLNNAKLALRYTGMGKILRKIEYSDVKISDAAFFFLMELSDHFTKDQLQMLGRQLEDEYRFLIKIHLLTKFGDHTQIQDILYKTEYSKAALKVLDKYMDTYAVPSWIKLLIRHHLHNEKEAFDKLENIDDPREWIHLLPHLHEEHRVQILKKVREYCLAFAENHIGMRAKQHLQSIGQLLIKNGFEREWEKIRREILNKFAYRNSIQSMGNTFL